MSNTFLFYLILLCFAPLYVKGQQGDEDVWSHYEGRVVKKDQRRPLVSTEYGEVSAVEISDGERRPYHLQFITLEPNALFLPVLLHADMLFYVRTGSGKLSYTDDDDILRINLKQGDVYRLQPGSVFYLQSNLVTEREKLRISAIFANSDDDLHVPSIGAYSRINDLVRGFDKKVLQATFKVPEEVIEALTNATKPPAIVHAVSKEKSNLWEWEVNFVKAFVGARGYIMANDELKNKKTKTFNLLEANPDFKNCNGWSLTVTKKELPALKGSQIGIFMVNLTKGSMMAPHWNPMATEIGMVVQGQGMVQVVCSSSANKCKNARFKVDQGDVFAIPRYHPMAQMSYNNDSLVFVGFSTTTKKNHPQFLVGKASVLNVLDKSVLAASFNVSNTTIDHLLAARTKSVILDCTSCAEGEEKIMVEEIEKKKQEEEAKKRAEEEEEAKKRAEEEARRQEEEEAKKRAEEEARRQEEEEAKKRAEEEARKREEEEEARRREEEEAMKRAEEEARRRQEEEAKKRSEEEAGRRQEEEAEKREEARREEEEARRQEEEKEKREREQQQEEEKQGREEEARKKQQGEAARQEEAREKQQQQQQEEIRRQEAARRQEEAREKQRQQEEEKRKQEAARRREEAREQQQQEEEKRRQAEKQGGRGGGEEIEEEQEEAKRQEEARQKQQQKEAAEREATGGGRTEGRRVLKKVWKV